MQRFGNVQDVTNTEYYRREKTYNVLVSSRERIDLNGLLTLLSREETKEG